MQLGLLADIHEQAEQLRRAVAVLRRHGADRFVVLGDVFETGKRMEETVGLLRRRREEYCWPDALRSLPAQYTPKPLLRSQES
jgi:hypothetical protein